MVDKLNPLTENAVICLKHVA